jgi:hypothetical protein
MKPTTRIITGLNLAAGAGCSGWVFASQWNSKEFVIGTYLLLGVAVPVFATLVVTCLNLVIEKKWDWPTAGLNSIAYALVYLLIGGLGLPEAIKEKNTKLLIWLVCGGGTVLVSFGSGMLGRVIMRKRIAQPATAPYSEPGARSPQG